MRHSSNKVIDLLFLARQKGVEIMVKEERLQLKIVEDREIDEQLLNEIRTNKQLIIDYLTSDDWKSVSINSNYKKITSFDRNSVEHIPASFSQERLWFIDHLGGSIEYHSPTVMRLTGNLDKQALIFSLKTIVERHEVLRTVFYEMDGQVYQSVKDGGSWGLQYKDGSVYRENSGGLKLYIEGLIKEPFDLAKDFPVRATLISLGKQEYILVVTMHHIASDAWSTSVIINEVVELYSSSVEGRNAKLAALPLQYADFSVWQRNYLQGNVLNKKIAYWKNKLEGQQTMQLPADYARTPVKSTQGASAAFSVDKGLSGELHDLCQKEGVSMFMLLLAALKVLLYRYSGQQDITVGTSIASRQQKDLEAMIGFFVNTLALRDEVDPGASFTNLLQQVKTTTLEAYEHQDIPFEKVVEVAAKDRDPGRSPLFQVMLVLANTPEVSKLVLGDVELTGETFITNISKFDITFFISETPDGLFGNVEYSTDLYRAPTIERMLVHYEVLLRSLVTIPEQQVGLLPMLTPQETQQLVMGNNLSTVVYPRDRTVVDLFEAQAAQNPGNTALVFEQEMLTYQQLDEQSNQLAHYLQRKGVQPGVLVPLFMERSALMITAMLGILKAGAAYVPIDTDFPLDRIRYMLQDTGAAIIVGSRASISKLHLAAGVELVAIEDTTDEPLKSIRHKPSATDLAYVIYTSGSTGNPKGVMIEHRNLLDYYYGLNQAIQTDQCKSFALFSTIATDLGNTVIFASLLSGGALHIFSKESVSNIEYLHRYFSQQKIDCIKIVPSHWKALRNEEKLLLPKKLLVFGGEALLSEDATAIYKSGSTCRVVNHYGPTETTIGKLLHEVKPAGNYSTTIPIGRPFSNTAVYVLSKEMQPCATGIPGQLYITGEGLARGYYNNETLTTEKFIANPFSKATGSRMYGTGDLVQWLPDGNIAFIGRVDNQVKIRGYRVELGEIENVLQQSEAVSQAVVLAKADQHDNKRLIGYIVPDGYFDREGILSYLAEKLPEYMIPGVLVAVESMPLMANGKIDRKALPDPDITSLLSEKYIAPRNETEVKLAAIWAEVLEIDEIGVEDDFFELGGHSLLAVRLVSAIRKAFAVEMPIGDIFEYPTVGQLSQQLTQKQDTPDMAVLPAIELLPRPELIPLSFSQERLWFIDQLDGSLQYHIPAVLQLTGKPDTAALSHALQQIINRHEVLRTIIVEHNGAGYQHIQPTDGWQLTMVDGAIYQQDAGALQQYIKENIETPFQLSQDYMLRATLITLNEEEHVLVATLHHIASDGWSTSILVSELAELYNSFTEGRQASLPQLPVQYADYAIWQRKYLQGEAWEKKLSYWKEKLEGTAVLQLPTDYVRPLVQSTRGAVTGFQLDKELSEQLYALSRQQGTTLFMTLLAAFKVLLYRYSGQQDICVGTPIAGRQQSELEGLIGFFLNTLALRTEVAGSATFTELLAQVKATTLAAYEHQEVPFEKVVELVVKERDMSRSPLFQVMFVLQNTPEVDQLHLNALQLSRAGTAVHTTAKFDLTVYATETANGLHLSAEYGTDLFKEQTINKLMAHFVVLLRSVVSANQLSIDKMPMLSVGEERLLLETFNNTYAAYPLDKTITDLFKEQVDRTPEATALIFGKTECSYQQLDDQSTRLANYLNSKNVAHGTFVPVCMHRSIHTIIAILGVLKAGGVYVPIDADYPQERIGYILEDTGAKIFLTDTDFALSFSTKNDIEIICVDNYKITNPGSIQPLQHSPKSELVCIAYTSGSSGKPKGVKLTHAGITNRLHWMWTHYPFEPNERNAIKTSIGFVDHIWEIFGALNYGIPSVIFRKEELLDLDILVKKLSDEKITRWVLVPSLLKTLLNKLETDGIRLPHLKYWTSSGETLPVDLVTAFYKLFPSAGHTLLNIYGSSEVTADVTCYDTSYEKYDKHQTKSYQHIPIGKPIANTRLYILDKHHQLVVQGVMGEICVSGVQVTQGYLNLPELSAERFINDPFSSATLFKTGDYGRWLPDGNMEYLGRIDAQVKIRGNRVELGEVEMAVKQTGLVKECVVMAKPDTDGSNSLVAYVIAEGSIDRQQLIVALKEKLPDFMVPHVWMQVDNFPLTASGKINKKALPEPDSQNLVQHEYVGPRNETESKLVQIWQDILHLERVGIYNDFFELGGHSLMAMRLVSAIRKELKAEISIRSIFTHSTIAALAAHLEMQEKQSLFPPVEVMPRPELIPLSFSQERLWFIDQLDGSLQYHIPAVLQLTGKPDTAALSHALQQIINRHEVLRTIIVEHNGAGYQHIQPTDGWQLTMVDGAIYQQDAGALQQYIKENIETPFQLSQDYMLRATLITLNEEAHVLVATLHHIASDGWSTSILVSELAELYNSFTEGRQASLPQLPVQYADYAIWQRKYLQGEAWEKKLSYWKEKLEGTAVLQLPTDYVRPLVQSTRGAVTGFQLDKELSEQLYALSRQQGTTLFMTLLAAFKVLLYRYSGQQDICVGTPIAGRQQSELEGLIGFFVNTLALRTEVAGSATFAELLAQVKATTLAAYENQEVPFEKVVELVVKERDMSRSPLFQVMFVLQNTPEVDQLHLNALQLSRAGAGLSGYTTSKFDLTFYLSEAKNGLHITIEYCTDLYSEQTINRMMVHFGELLRSVVKDPVLSIATLPMLGMDEKQQLLIGFNNHSSDYPELKSIVDVFEEQVLKYPDNIALQFDNGVLTYRQLNDLSNQLAHYLAIKGVRTGTMVPLFIEKSKELIIGILGILKAGGAYVPIDPEYPGERISYMFDDITATMVLTSIKCRQKLPDNREIEILELDRNCAIINKQPVRNLNAGVSPEDTANIIYTSGSTGKPKGVTVTQRNVVSLVKGVDYVSLTSKDVLLSTGSPSFDAATFEYWSMLLNGGTLVLAAESKLLDIKLLKEEIVTRKVNLMWFTSGWFNQLVDADITLFETLQTILVGGEKLSEHHIEKLRQTYPSIKVINGYGPTENTSFSLTYCITEREIHRSIPIGRPLSNRSALILDSNHQLVPVGVSGEIFLGGVGLSAGYLNQPELTAEKFIQNPFRDLSGEKIYKTGDIGRWLHDGNIEYLGRMDDQVKIRGYRIESGEVEMAVKQTGLVKECVVMAKPDTDGSNSLVAYVIAEGSIDRQQLIVALKEKLPDFMVPHVWMQVDNFPLTASGKINKKALPEPDSQNLVQHEYVGPRNETESKLIQIWQNILHLERVGIYNDFFELGGHSLMAMRLVSAIRKELKAEISIRSIFTHSTIAALAAHLEMQEKQSLFPPVEVMPRPELIPLSFSQERLWFIDQLDGSLQYHIPAVLQLTGKPDTAALSHALQQIINRHEVLRTIIVEHNGAGYQHIQPTDGWQLTMVDGAIYQQDAGALQQYIKENIETPFQLSQDYMLRASLITLNEEAHVLVATLHHIASDGWSTSILVSELAELYNSFTEGRQASLPQLPVQYADYAIWQRKYLQGEAWEKKLSYWKEKLEDTAVLQLPTDYVRPLVQSTRGAVTGFQLDKELSEQLHALSRQQGATMFMTLLAAFKVLLYRYSGQQDICVGTPIAGRQQSELEGLIGFFVNTLALRTEVAGSATFAELLAQVKATTLAAYEHQEVPFEKVVELVVKERDMSRSPLLQVMLALQNTPETGDLHLNELTLSHGLAGASMHNTSKFDLTFNITEIAQGLQVSVEYCTDLYTEQTIQRMIAHFTALLHSLIKTPQQSIALLAMLDDSEEQQLLVDFNHTQFPFPHNESIVHLFEAQVAQTPEAKAVVFEQEELTYRQLNDRANQLANYLIEKGIQPGEHVGLLSLRKFEMIIGILGILKSGAAYVPFNTEYPAERLQYIAKDASIRYIVYTDLELMNSSGLTAFECIDLDESAYYPTNAVSVKVGPDSAVYIMYTSGTTGRPKGIAVCNRNVIKLVYEPGDIAVGPQDRMLQWSNYAFDGSVYEMYASLLKGAGLYLIKEAWASDVYELGRVMKEQEITVCFITTALFNTFIDVNPDMLKGLRKILFGGEKVSFSHVRKAFRVLGPGKIVHVYGPTETTTYATYYPVNSIQEDGVVPIGKPLANTRLYVLDTSRHVVPLGVQGELYIGGDGVALGYVNNDGLNAEKFLSITIGIKKERLYRTGDVVRRMTNGDVDYVGRIDNQVKIRGYRIEPEEIENVLQESDMLSKAVVMVRENAEGNKLLVGYISTTNLYDKQHLISWLQDRLPSYMVPVMWVEMNSFPLNPNGKIDKKALPDPDISQLAGNHHYEAPRNKTEVSLAEIWQNLLGTKTIGIHDNFFELGGDSILTLQVVHRAKRIGYDLQPRDIFIHQTIARLSEAISNRSTLIVSGEQGFLTGSCGLLPIQQWYLEESEETVSHFNQSVLLGIDKAISSAVLSTALEQLTGHHDALRFKYYQKEGEWYQEYGTHSGALVIEDLRTVQNDQLGTVITQKANIYQRSLNIQKGELIRIVWMQTPDAEKQNRLLVVIHHLAVDGVSWRILIENLEFLLTGLQKNQEVNLGIKSSSYRQWYQALKQYGQRRSVLSQISYWENILSSYQPLAIDKGSVEKVRQKNISNVVMTLGSVQTTRLLKDVPKTYHTEINDILLSALAITLRDWGGIDKVIIGLEGHGREEIVKGIDTSRTVGWFTNLYPVLLEISKEQQAGEAIKSVKGQLRQVPDKGLGFGVLKYINNEKKLAGKPRWNIVFNYLGQLDNVVQQGKWFTGARESAGQSISDEQPMNEQLSVNGSVRGGQLILFWSYNSEDFEKEAINDLVRRYQENLELLIDHCIEQQKSGIVFNPLDYESPSFTPFYEIDTDELPEVNNKYLVPIKTNGNKIPLYIVAGGGATAHKFMKFAKMMDPDQPVYILQAPDEPKHLKEFPDTIEKIAASFLEEVIADNPKGPYALSGHCTGGLIAYEMARQLKARGKKIHMLALFDTIAPIKEKPQPANFKNLYYIPIYLKRAISKTIIKVDFEMFLLRKYTRNAIGYKVKSLKNLMQKSKKGISADKLEYTGMEIYDETSDIYVAAHNKYQILPYDGNIITFYAKERYYFFDRERNISYKQWNLGENTKNSWKAYAASTSIYEIKGEHSDIFDPLHGEEFAQTLQKLLDNS